ncbi:hypothetical protein [Thalassotalea ganghwensis]
MTQTFNGIIIDAQPPISTITVNKFCVVFKDRTQQKTVSLQNSLETKKFIHWLTAM